MSEGSYDRSFLPIPDRPRTGLVTYDAKDPDTKYPRSSKCGRRRARPISWSS